MKRAAACIGAALGMLLVSGMGVPAAAQDVTVDPLHGIDIDPTAAAPDNADARFTDELMRDAGRYAAGRDYEYNPFRAYELYTKAAESGDPAAVYHVARCLILGEGVARNKSKGVRILEDLAAILVQAEGFRHVKGFNPALKKSFKPVEELRPESIRIEVFKTRNGSEISSPKVLSISDKSLRMMHASGISTFQWEELPAYVQEAMGYDVVSGLFETALVAAVAARK